MGVVGVYIVLTIPLPPLTGMNRPSRKWRRWCAYNVKTVSLRLMKIEGVITATTSTMDGGTSCRSQARAYWGRLLDQWGKIGWGFWCLSEFVIGLAKAWDQRTLLHTLITWYYKIRLLGIRKNWYSEFGHYASSGRRFLRLRHWRLHNHQCPPWLCLQRAHRWFIQSTRRASGKPL